MVWPWHLVLQQVLGFLKTINVINLIDRRLFRFPILQLPLIIYILQEFVHSIYAVEFLGIKLFIIYSLIMLSRYMACSDGPSFISDIDNLYFSVF